MTALLAESRLILQQHHKGADFMGLEFEEFCLLAKLEPGTEVFAFWLASHRLNPALQDRVVQTLISNY